MQVIADGSSVAVIGDGKLGLLVAQVLAMQAERHNWQVVLFGRHQAKLSLVEGCAGTEVVSEHTATTHAAVRAQHGRRSNTNDCHTNYAHTMPCMMPRTHSQAFDVTVEACGKPEGFTLALALTRPLGTVVLKSTCSLDGHAAAPQWSAAANDVVVQEKRVIGSRCGPFAPALEALQDARVKRLVGAMVHGEYALADVEAAIAKASSKGTLKVQLVMG